MPKGYFDAEAFYAALDAQRLASGQNWKQVAAESSVSASTLTRMAQGRRPDVDSLAALLAWSGLRAEDFVREGDHGQTEATLSGGEPGPGRGAAEPLAMISTYLRSDRHLTAEGAIALEELIKATYKRLRKD